MAKGLVRQRGAEYQRKGDVAVEALRAVERKYLDELRAPRLANDRPAMVEKFLSVVEPIERGEIDQITDPVERKGAEALRRLLDEREEPLRRLGILRAVHEEYLGRLWKDPQDPNATADQVAERIRTRKSLAGGKGFAKQKVYEDFRTGFDAGLEPVTWNPYEMQRLKMAEMDHAVFGHQLVDGDLIPQMGKYVPLSKRTPAGMSVLDDPLLKQYAPPEMRVKEWFDQQQMEGLEKFADGLGIDVKAVTNPGRFMGPSPGMAKVPHGGTAGAEVTRRFGTPETVLAHEIGHHLDVRYQMSDWAKDPAVAAELQGLSELRSAGWNTPLQDPVEWIPTLVTAYLHTPDLLKTEAPKSLKLLQDLIQSRPELRPLADIKPGLELGEREQYQRLAGPMLVGHYALPTEVVGMLKQYLSEGLRGNKVYDALRLGGNTVTQLNLGLSLFHGLGTTLNTVFSTAALGVKQLSRGDVGLGLASLGRAVNPLALWRQFRSGLAAQREWFAPGSQGAEVGKDLEAVMMGGARAGLDSFYKTSHIEQLRGGMKDLLELGRQEQYGRAGLEGAKGVLRAIPALLELTNKPVMEYWVPSLKLATAIESVKYELDWMQRTGRQQTPDTLRDRFGKIWDSVDNRLGQLVYDNLFWNRTFKDLALLSVRAVGWNVGTWREIGLGVTKDIPESYRGLRSGEGITDRLAYTIALTMGTGLMGAISMYAMTGQGPQSLNDYIYPRTGRKRQDGSDDRLSFPTYMHHDVAPLFNRAGEGPFRISKNVGKAGAAKLSPALTQPWETFVANEDWKGAAIHNWKDPWVQQTWDVLKHLGGTLKPFSIESMQRANQQGVPAGEQLLPFVGVMPANSAAVHTDAQQAAMEELRRYQPSPTEKKRQEGLKDMTPLQQSLERRLLRQHEREIK